VFEAGELCVEAAWPDAERPGSLVDAGVVGDHEEATDAPLRAAAAGEEAAEIPGELAARLDEVSRPDCAYPYYFFGPATRTLRVGGAL
jgi:hypothetical protein